jgi:hypothetical protein
MIDTPLEVLAEELGAITGRMEREAGLRLAAIEADLKRQATEIELRMLAAEIKATSVKDGEKGERGEPGIPGLAGADGAVGPAGDPNTTPLPPQLAAEVARAVQTLHEALPIVEYGERSVPPKVVRIERDEQGHLVPVYDN